MITVTFLLLYDKLQADALKRFGKQYRLVVWLQFFAFTLITDAFIGMGIYHFLQFLRCQ